jgi:RNA polymerase sigma factor (TIGR02999 family)
VTSPTEVLGAFSPEAQGAAELLPLLYDELRKLAIAKMAQEAPGQTLQPTALVHEAYLRLLRSGQSAWENRAHFFAAAAEAMRRILVENARRKSRLKHGGGWQRVELEQLDVASGSTDEQILAVHAALEKLSTLDPPVAELIKLRFFAGLSNAQAAELMGIPERTANRRWAYARAWLYQELRQGP